MAAAGIATLFITQDYTLQENWAICKGGVRNQWIERGLNWMDRNIVDALHRGDLYTMYGIERIGTASGRRFFGKVDWYLMGADFIVKHQGPDGGFGSGPGAIANTSFALLFLSRGRAPVIMNKLEYTTDKAAKGVTDVWNERPRDIANLARWLGRQEERFFNWQVVNLKVSPDELHDAPILYITGSQPLDFKQEEVDKLRAFVEQGGLILGNSDCNHEPFSKSFKELGQKLFPKYEFRRCSPNDLIYREQYKQWRMKPQVDELSNGVRKLMVLIPDSDPSRAWQTRSDRTKEPMYQLGANIYLYALDKKIENAGFKGSSYIVKSNSAVQPTATVKVARLDLGDNANPEPGGWPRLAAVMHNQYKVDVKPELVKLDNLSGFPIASLTGTGKLILSPAQRQKLKEYVDGGGTLIVDAAAGDSEFADSVEVELATIFGARAAAQLKVPLAPDSPVFTQTPVKITAVGWRNYARDLIVGDRRSPRIRGIAAGNRLGVLFSREDLSAGLVGEPVDGIYGYDPKTATDLMSAMIMYAAHIKPTTQPTTQPGQGHPATGQAGK